MATRDEELRIRIRLDDTGQITAQLGGVEKQIRKTGTAGKDASGGLLSLSSAGGALKTLLPTLGLAGAVGGLVALTKSAFDTASQLADTSTRVGIGVEALQELDYAAKQSGVSAGGLERALEGFTQRLGDARNGTGSLAGALKNVDVALLRNIQTAGSTEEALDLVFEALANTSSEADRAALANAAFGKSGLELLPMLKDGTAGLEAMRQRARDLGIVLGEDMVRSGADAGNAVGELGQVIKGNLNRVLIEAAPLIKDATGLLSDFTGTAFKALGGFNKWLAEFAGLTRQKFRLAIDYGSVELAEKRLSTLREEIAALEASGARGPDVDSRRREAGRIQDLLTAPTAGAGGDGAPAAAPAGDGAGAPGEGGGAGRSFVAKLQEELDALDFETALAGMSKFEQQVALAQQKVADLGLEGGASADVLVASADAMGEAVVRNLQAENFASGIDGLQKLTEEARKLTFAGPEAEFQQFMVTLNEQLAQGEISIEQYRQQVELAKQQFALLNDGQVVGVFNALAENFRRVEAEAKVFGTSVADENATKLGLLQKAMQDLIALGIDPSSSAFSTLKSQLDSASPSLSGIEDASKRLQGEFEGAATASGNAFRQIEEGARQAAENEALGETLPAALKVIKDEAGNIKIVADGTEAEASIGGVDAEFGKLVDSFNKANPKLAIDTDKAVEGLVTVSEKGIEIKRSLEGVPIFVKVNTGGAKEALASLKADAAKSPEPTPIRVDTSGAIQAINALREAASQPIVIPVQASGSPSKPFSEYFGVYAPDQINQFLEGVSNGRVNLVTETFSLLQDASRVSLAEVASLLDAIKLERQTVSKLVGLGVQRNLDTTTGRKTDLRGEGFILGELEKMLRSAAHRSATAGNDHDADRRHRESVSVGIRQVEQLGRVEKKLDEVATEQRKSNEGWASGRYAAPIVGAASRSARFAGIPN